jgi:acetyl-CoA carboxylase beta subunit
MAWFKRDTDENLDSEKRSVPAGVFTKCPGCRETILTADLKKQADVCPKCDHHFLMGTRDRVTSSLTICRCKSPFTAKGARFGPIDPKGRPSRARSPRKAAANP